VAAWSLVRPPRYSLEDFMAAMKRYFASASVVQSDPAPRVVIVFTGARPTDRSDPGRP
jgi:hypothetical protein